MQRSVLVLSLSLPACWKDDYTSVPPDVIAFQPEAGGPAGWSISPVEVPLDCPDDEPVTFWAIYPDTAAAAVPGPAVVLYHSGAFDFVFAPEPGNPLAGTHLAAPSRLDARWSVNQVFATMGMYPEQDGAEIHDGRLLSAVVERGVPVLLPTNCWGDLWANKSGGADNSFVDDFFSREGRASAEWAFRFLVDPTFAAAFDVTIPFAVDPAQVYTIGLGEGGRAVAEVASIDNDDDGAPDYAIAGALVDSVPDDLRVYYADGGLYASTIAGLDRIWPAGPDATAPGSWWSAPLPPRFAYAYSPDDPRLPVGINDATLARLAGTEAVVWVSTEPGHVLLNSASGAEVVDGLVDFLLTGTPPLR